MRLLKNKYLLTTLAFLGWIVFFDSNNLINQYKMHEKYKSLQDERAYYSEGIEEIEEEMEQLQSDPEAVEKYAREKYLMKRKGEDVFLIREKGEED